MGRIVLTIVRRVSSPRTRRVSGERECPVPPLAVPDLGTRPTPGSLARPDVHALSLRAEQDQQLGGLRSGAAEPVLKRGGHG
jgi:hypothetical protein